MALANTRGGFRRLAMHDKGDGVVPRYYSSTGKQKLLGISKPSVKKHPLGLSHSPKPRIFQFFEKKCWREGELKVGQSREHAGTSRLMRPALHVWASFATVRRALIVQSRRLPTHQ